MAACSVEGCGRLAYGRGLCSAHWQRWRRHGDPNGGRAAKGAGLSFVYSVLEREEDSCIDWPYGAGKAGYGETWYDGKVRTVHTLVCELKHGRRPSNQHDSAHSCGRRICCNHRHLRWATRGENVADAVRHGTQVRGEKTHNAKLKEAEVREIRRLQGICTQEELAARYGVHRAHIKDIQQRRRWAWLS